MLKQEFGETAKKSINPEIIGITIIAFAAAAVMFNYLGGIVISKDKNNIQVLKTLPITFKKQYKIKLIIPKVLSFSVFAIYYLLICIAIQEKAFTYYPLVGLITAILTISNNIELAGIIDLLRPNLSWKTEMELTKRSLTIFIWTILVFTKIAGYIYLSTKNELKDTIIMIASIEVVSYMVIEGFKYMFIDKLFYRLQKD